MIVKIKTLDTLKIKRHFTDREACMGMKLLVAGKLERKNLSKLNRLC